jgi:predicted RNA-binding Zn-ribbon protein involved in translation (DUF1610 family)
LGYPETPEPTRDENAAPVKRGKRGVQNHGDGCRCQELAWRDTRPGRQPRFVVNVTCPDCGDERIARIHNGHKAEPVCRHGYMSRCNACGARRAAQAGNDSYRKRDAA